MTTPTHLRSLQALQLAVQTGSLIAAAEKLSITPAAVGQRIKILEDYLGVDLIVRSRSGLRPTRELQSALPYLNAAFVDIAMAVDVLNFQRVNEIHIVADPDFAELWLRPRLADFQDSHQNTHFCINGVGDIPLRLGQADCEIWFGAPRGGAAEDKLFADYLLPVGSPFLAARSIAERRVEDRLEGFLLLHLECYSADPEALGWPAWIRQFGHRKTAPESGIRYAHVVQALSPLYSHAGFLLCGLALVNGLLLDKKIATPFPLAEGARTGFSYNISYRAEAIRRNRIPEFRNWLLAQSSKTEQMIEEMS